MHWEDHFIHLANPNAKIMLPLMTVPTRCLVSEAPPLTWVRGYPLPVAACAALYRPHIIAQLIGHGLPPIAGGPASNLPLQAIERAPRPRPRSPWMTMTAMRVRRPRYLNVNP